MLLFTITGITLNHAGRIESKPRVTAREVEAPKDVLATLADGARPRKGALATT